jgi:plastocyanin
MINTRILPPCRSVRAGLGLTVVALLALASSTLTAQSAPAGDAGSNRATRPDTTVTLRSTGSALEFLPARLALKTGLRVRVRYTNEGSLPHNLVFVKDDADLDALSTEAYGAGDSGFVPTSMKDRLLAFTPLVAANQTVEVEFVVPAPGEYTFICLFPGHANMMVGTLRAVR